MQHIAIITVAPNTDPGIAADTRYTFAFPEIERSCDWWQPINCYNATACGVLLDKFEVAAATIIGGADGKLIRELDQRSIAYKDKEL